MQIVLPKARKAAPPQAKPELEPRFDAVGVEVSVVDEVSLWEGRVGLIDELVDDSLRRPIFEALSEGERKLRRGKRVSGRWKREMGAIRTFPLGETSPKRTFVTAFPCSKNDASERLNGEKITRELDSQILGRGSKPSKRQ